MFNILQTYIPPVDNAFSAGKLDLPTIASEAGSIAAKQWDEYALPCIFGLISLVAALILIRSIVSILPSLLGCLWRSKECINLEDSLQLSSDRNIIAWVLVVPFALVSANIRLWNPKFLGLFNPNIVFLIVLGVLLLYIGIRLLLNAVLRPRNFRTKEYNAGNKAFRTFFVIIALTALATAGIMMMAGSGKEQIRNVILWESAAIYFIYLIRKCQIFVSGGSIFSTFLYLCALEIVPTGLLVVSAIEF